MAFYVPGCPPKTVIPIEKALHPTTRNTERRTRNSPKHFYISPSSSLHLFYLLPHLSRIKAVYKTYL